LSKWGDIDEDIIFKFEPLEEMNYLEKAQIEKTKADTDQVYIDAGVLDPKEMPRAIGQRS
jgi:hypothetical protein